MCCLISHGADVEHDNDLSWRKFAAKRGFTDIDTLIINAVDMQFKREEAEKIASKLFNDFKSLTTSKNTNIPHIKCAIMQRIYYFHMEIILTRCYSMHLIL